MPKVIFAQLNFANIEGRCYCCGKLGHFSPNCRLKDTKPKEEWATPESKAEHAKQEAPVIAQIMCHVNDLKEHSFIQNYSLKKAKTVFGERALNAAFKEMKQMHDGVCFEPISKNSMTAL